MKPTDIWQATLGELQLQMTRGTFASWLSGTRVLPSSGNGTLEIGVANEYALDWLANRLRDTITRTVSNVAGREMVVRFVVVGDGERTADDGRQTADDGAQTTDDEPSPIEGGRLLEELRGFSPQQAGWAPYSEYAVLFWAPLLGRVAWPLYLRVRMDDRRSKRLKEAGIWTPPRRYYAPKLARSVGCGKQAITGVWRKCEPERTGAICCDEAGLAALLTERPDLADRLPPQDGEWRRRQGGGLERLETEDAARYERQGREPHVFYVVRVRVELPLLTPVQVGRLPAQLVTQHDRWIYQRTTFDPLYWSVNGEDEW